MIAGVAGGIAQHLGVDATLVRLAWVAVALLAGGGVLLYLVAWLIMSEEPVGGTPAEVSATAPRGDSAVAAWILGGVLIAFGVIWLIGPLAFESFRYLLPAIPIVIGIAIIASATRR